jgi:hypothetical protein
MMTVRPRRIERNRAGRSCDPSRPDQLRSISPRVLDAEYSHASEPHREPLEEAVHGVQRLEEIERRHRELLQEAEAHEPLVRELAASIVVARRRRHDAGSEPGGSASTTTALLWN